MNRTHALAAIPDTMGRAKTHCGIAGVQEEDIRTEFSTVQGFRFEIAEPNRMPSCSRCRDAIKREAGTPGASKAVPNV